MFKTIFLICIAFSFCAGGLPHRRQIGEFCPLVCPAVDEPVCASNGITYKNPCLLHKAHCIDETVHAVHNGPCRVARGIFCITFACQPIYEPVCGNDGKTYNNVCELNNAMCDNEYLKVHHTGVCHPAN